jgi:hypothetical protein
MHQMALCDFKINYLQEQNSMIFKMPQSYSAHYYTKQNTMPFIKSKFTDILRNYNKL